MLIAAFIFVLSFAALIQFGVLQWRASLIRVAAASFPGEHGLNSEVSHKLLKDKGFSDVAAFQKICPDMGGAAPRLWAVRLYRRFLQLIAGLGAAGWVAQEIELCARYSAAVLLQQVQRNQAVVAEVSSV